jgi:hypothetical protein
MLPRPIEQPSGAAAQSASEALDGWAEALDGWVEGHFLVGILNSPMLIRPQMSYGTARGAATPFLIPTTPHHPCTGEKPLETHQPTHRSRSSLLSRSVDVNTRRLSPTRAVCEPFDAYFGELLCHWSAVSPSLSSHP